MSKECADVVSELHGILDSSHASPSAPLLVNYASILSPFETSTAFSSDLRQESILTARSPWSRDPEGTVLAEGEGKGRIGSLPVGSHRPSLQCAALDSIDF